jgi:GT2 family glycosyltransferase
MSVKVSVIVILDHIRGDYQIDLLLSSHFRQSANPKDFELILATSSHADHQLVNNHLDKCKDKKPASLNIQSLYCGEAASRAKAANLAMRLSKAPILHFLADDFILSSDAVSATLEFHHANPHETAVGIGAAFVPDTLRSDFVDWLEHGGSLFGVPFYPEMTSVPDNFFYLGNVSIKRALLEKAGQFDEAFPYHAWDDWEMGLRLVELGMKSTLIPQTNAIHRHRLSLADRCQSLRLAGESARIFQRKHPDFNGPWLAYTWKSAFAMCMHTFWTWLKLTTAPSSEHLAAYFQSTTHLAFIRGYLGEA